MIYLLVLLSLIFNPATGFAQSIDKGKKMERIDVQDKPFEDVMRIVAKHSGYEISLVGYQGSSRITGVFYLSDVEKTLQRMFKGTNVFIEFHEKEKKIVVRFPQQGLTKNQSGPIRPTSNREKVDLQTGLAPKQLLEARERERQEQIARTSDPNEIDPTTGISYVEQVATLERERQEQVARTSDPGEIDPTTGVSYVEQVATLERERQEQVARTSDPGEIDPTTGISYVEQVAMRKREWQEQIARTTDPGEIDPTTGVPYVKQLSVQGHK